MNYTFKLSRRMARFRAALPIVAAFLALSCSDDASGPASPAASDQSDTSVTPELAASGRGQSKSSGKVVKLEVTPQTVSLAAGATKKFSATATLRDGSTTQPSVSWTAKGGSIDSTGLYTAGSTPGAYDVIATDPASHRADTAGVTIGSVSLSVSVNPDTANLTTGETLQLSASVKDAGGAVLSGQTITWASSNPAAATVSSTGMVSAVGDGDATVTASSDGTQGTAMLKISAATTATSAGCPTSGYVRLVNVGTPTQLRSAIDAAQPGDQIRLAAGTYSVGQLTMSRSGTSARPITLCGPRSAIINNGGSNTKLAASWWKLRGFKVTGGISGVWLSGAHYSVVDSLLVEYVGNNGIAVGQSSTHNTVQYNTVRETGRSTAHYGEGIYVGNGSTGSDPSDSNTVQYNVLGPYIRAEHVQVTSGTTGNVIRGNISNTTGVQYITNTVTAPYWSMGNRTVFENNTITNIAGGSSFPAMLTYTGYNNVYRGNRVFGVFPVGFSVSTGRGNIVYCSNSASGGTFSNVACTQ